MHVTSTYDTLLERDCSAAFDTPRRGRRPGAAPRPSAATTRRTASWRSPSGSVGRRATSPRRSRRAWTWPASPSVEVAGPGFLNLTLDHGVPRRPAARAARRRAPGIAAGVDARRRVVIDYSAPNVAKEMHVGTPALDGHRRRAGAHVPLRRPPRRSRATTSATGARPSGC